MTITSLSLNVNDVSKLLTVTPNSIYNWIRKGKLNGKFYPTEKLWIIKGRDILQFLYNNPKYVTYLRGQTFDKYYSEIQKTLLTALDKKGILYSRIDIANMFCVTPDAVTYWVKKGYLKPIKINIVGNSRVKLIFDENSIDKFILNCPQYARLYVREGENCMLMKDIVLNRSDITKLLGVSTYTAKEWCKSGKIKAYRDTKNGYWKINARDFAQFLYHNQEYINYFEHVILNKRFSEFRTMILQKIRTLPPLYTKEDIASILYVAPETVKRWDMEKKIKAIEVCRTNNKKLYNTQSILDFLQVCPEYKILYENYIRKGESAI